MELQNLIQELSPAAIEGPITRQFEGLACDARRISPGMVFILLPDGKADGPAQVRLAVERGAVAVISQKNHFYRLPAAQIAVENVRAAMAQAASFYYSKPAQKLVMVGVTGGESRAETAFFLKQLLQGAGINSGLIGSMAVEIGNRILPPCRPMIDIIQTQDLLAQMVRHNCAVAILELGPDCEAEGPTEEARLDLLVFTPEETDPKERLPALKLLKPAGKIILSQVNQLNPPESSGSEGAAEGADGDVFSFTNVRLNACSTEFELLAAGKRYPCRNKLIGWRSTQALITATRAAATLGLPVTLLQTALCSVKPAPGKMELVSSDEPFSVIVDDTKGEGSFQRILAALRLLTAGRVILVFGLPGEVQKETRRPMGRIASAMAHYTIITSDNPRSEDPLQIAAQIAEGFRENKHFEIVVDRKEAITRAIAIARADDIVLIHGKGNQTYQEFENTVCPFDDREVARAALYERAFQVENVPERFEHVTQGTVFSMTRGT